MSSLPAYLNRQRRRLRFYEFLNQIFVGTFVLFCLFAAMKAFAWLAALFFGPLPYLSRVIEGLSVLMSVFVLSKVLRKWSSISWNQTATQIEAQSKFFRSSSDWRSELISATQFLKARESGDFEQAHIRRVALALPQWAVEVRPQLATFVLGGLSLISVLLVSSLPSHLELPVPQNLRAWTPSSYEILFPYPQAPWIKETGALQGVRGSRIRFEAPAWSPFAVYVFVRSAEGVWSALPCQEYCEMTLTNQSQYALGTLISRSSFFPVNVYDDEAPKSALFAQVKEEWVPALVLEVFNEVNLSLEIVASDDLRLKKIEVIHRFNNQDEILETFETSEKHFKSKFNLAMDGWKGGDHEVLLRPYDDFQSSLSSSLRIIFNDEESLRQKRLEDLNALIIEWTHILADLIDSKLEGEVVEGLAKRLKSFDYPETEDGTLIAGYVNELKLLSKRIEAWTSQRAPMNRVDDLISRVEKQILYGLSLIFQEKAGDLKSTSQELAESQKDLSKMLEQIKDGKMKLDSKALEEAFKKLTDKLKELQDKISSLPQGPQDEMINREALEAQAAESEDLAKRIEEIRKQAEAGDEKGALRELESLLNQLSILTKEMERGLDQWQGNLDQGALQKAQEFGKKLETIKKDEMALNEKTKILKEKMKQIDEKNEMVLSQKDAQEMKKLQEQMKALEEQQKSVGDKFQEARREFDTALEGTEWKQLFRGDEAQSLENEIGERFMESEDGLRQQQLHEADSAQKESIDLLNKAQQQQKQMQQQVQQLSKQEQSTGGLKREKIEIKGNEAKGEKERRRRIMESLKQRVGDKFQQSHERYFEELLQR